jgi:hypothetical protein
MIESKIPYHICPAPWQLKGEGYLMLYRFSKDFLMKEGFISEELNGAVWMNLGLVMLVNYQDSPVGPYGELLFIPGMFHYNGKYYWHISKIYVSSWDSVMNGRENWGIPKELAEFEFKHLDQVTQSIKVMQKDQLIFSGVFKDKRWSMPLSTALFPFKFIQPFDGKQFITHPIGSGKAFFSKLQGLETGQGLFPSIGTQTRIVCMHIPDFKLVFPNPQFL